MLAGAALAIATLVGWLPEPTNREIEGWVLVCFVWIVNISDKRENR
jgi:hypothetical protein